MKKYFIFTILIVALISSFGCCGVRTTLSGMSIPEQARTVSVQFFRNEAPLSPPTLAQIITESLKDKFIRETKLQLVDRSADIEFEGSIIGYNVAPMALQGNETAALNRLTVNINVSYTNKFDEKSEFTTSFSRFADFPGNQALAAVEGALIEDIVQQLVQDVFNRAFINW
jgi:hypothetical protein